MTACRLRDNRPTERLLHLALQHGFVQVMPAVQWPGRLTANPTHCQPRDSRPNAKGDSTQPAPPDEILLVARTKTVDVASKGLLGYREVGVLDAQSGAFEEPQAGAVEQHRHQPR